VIANLKKEEIVYSSKGKIRFSKKLDPITKNSLEILQTRYQKGDLRKAEALARAAPDDLQLFKSLLSRGFLTEARIVLDRLLLLPSFEEGIPNEILLQEARYSYLAGNWKDAVLKCNLLDRVQNILPLDKMTLYQIRANAYFELSDFANSEADMKKMECFETIFPNGQLPLYAHTNQLRLLSRQISTDQSKKMEDKLWDNWRRSLPTENLDPLLTLIRARIERLRIEKTNFSKESIAAWLISDALGDELYSGLACFDLYTSIYPFSIESPLEKELNTYLSAHSRIQKLMEEVFSSDATQSLCETAKTIRNYISVPRPLSNEITIEKNEIKLILLFNLGVLVDLKSRKISKVELQPQSREIIKLLMSSSTNKENLFLAIWKLNAFSPERHDSVIRTALHRIRQQSGIEIQCHQQEISLDPSTLVIEI
jgi:hypothetical protein